MLINDVLKCLFSCPQSKDILFTVSEEQRKTENIRPQEAGIRVLFFLVTQTN